MIPAEIVEINRYPLACHCSVCCLHHGGWSKSGVCVTVVSNYLEWFDYLGSNRSEKNEQFFSSIDWFGIGIERSKRSLFLEKVSDKVIWCALHKKVSYQLKPIDYSIKLQDGILQLTQ